MKVVVPMAEGFEEIELVTVVDLLRRAEVEVVTAGLKEGPVEGSHNIKITPDTSLDEINPDDFDAIFLAGGFPGYVNLGEDERVLEMIRLMDGQGKYVTALCGAPTVLIKAGVLEGRKVTINPGSRDELSDEYYQDARVVVDGNLITSKSAGTAIEFALKLVGVLAGEDRMWQLKETILAECDV